MKKYSMIGTLIGLMICANGIGSVRAENRNSKADTRHISFMDGYWSHYFVFGPPRVDPAELVKAKESGSLKKHLSKYVGNQPFKGVPFYSSFSRDPAPFAHRSAPPSPDWFKSDFDDSLWPRYRRPFGTWGLVDFTDKGNNVTKMACFRGRFIVPNPGKVRKLTLNVICRGGAAVYVNGREVGRRHLPGGALKPDTPGAPYPRDVYALPKTDKFPYRRRRGAKERGIPEIMGEFPGPDHRLKRHFEKDASKFKIPIDAVTTVRGFNYDTIITKDEWNRIQAVRDRKLSVEISGEYLKKGTNILAIELHRSDAHPIILGYSQLNASGMWTRIFLLDAKLDARPSGAVRLPERPSGIQVWVEDVHRRVFSPDFGPEPILPDKPGCIRILASRNGVFSGQAVIGTAVEIKGLKAGTSPLTGPEGAKILPSLITVRYGRGTPFQETADMCVDRGDVRNYSRLLAKRYELGSQADDRKLMKKKLNALVMYDHLSEQLPEHVPADSCVPVWITVKVPEKACPGLYSGTLSVRIDGFSKRIPVKMQVIDWKIPDPGEWDTVVALEHTPYGIAKHYKVPLWSDKHFRLIESSFKWLGQVGNDFLLIPVITNSEFGNRKDAIIRWEKSGSGYRPDFSIFDRYLTLALKYFKPRVVCPVVAVAVVNWHFHYPKVLMKDGSLMEMPKPGTPEGVAFWKPFVEGVQKRLAAYGLENTLTWGYLQDQLDSKKNKGHVMALIKMLRELAPHAGWAVGSHQNRCNEIYSFASSIRSPKFGFKVEQGKPGHPPRVITGKGWKTPTLDITHCRTGGGSRNVLVGIYTPFGYRLHAERAICQGLRGIGRIGADYWGTYVGADEGLPITQVLWPGKQGAESSVRFEMLLEGIQDSEARIFLEKKLENRTFADAPQGRAVQAMLDRRFAETACIPFVHQSERMAEYFGNWQQRNWDLYAAAAQAAGGRAPGEREKKDFFR